MRLVVPSIALLSCAAWARAQEPPPDKVVAKVDGESVTVSKLADLLTGAPSLALNSAGNDPAEFLTWTHLFKKMSAEAVRQGLDKKSPYVDRIDWNRAQVLMMARIEEKNRESIPNDQEVETLYRDNPQRYGTAKTKLIFVPAGPGAKVKMDLVAAQARKGVDFVRLVKLYSADEESAAKDGDFAEIKPDSRIPEDIRKQIFQTKAGGLSPVIVQPAGFYLFKLTALAMRPLDEVRNDARNITTAQRGGEWMAAEKKKAQVKILHEEFFKALPKTAGGMATGRSDTINLQAAPQTAEITPTTLLAEINGRPLNAAGYTSLIKALPPQIRTKAIVEPTGFLRDYAFMQWLVEDALRVGLDQKQPFRNRLSYDRGMTLMQAAVDEYLNNIVVTVEEQKAGFTADPNKYRFANTRVIYVAYSLTPPPQADPQGPKILNEQEALAKAETILKEAREDKDGFPRLVAKYSDDQSSREEGGIMRPIGFLDPQVPDNVKQPIFAAKAGDVVGPVRMANGFYLFKVDTIDVRNYEDVKDQIYEELRQQRFQDWFNGQRNSIKVTVEDAQAFRDTVARSQQQTAPPAPPARP